MTPLTLKPVVVPIDFSEASFSALSRAIAFAGGTAQIHVVHVLYNLSAVEPGVIWGDVDEPGRITSATASLKAELEKRGAGGATVHVVVSTSPARAIVDYAKSQDAPLIVLSANGHTGIERLLLGSVTERVVRLADCDVLVARPPQL